MKKKKSMWKRKREKLNNYGNKKRSKIGYLIFSLVLTFFAVIKFVFIDKLHDNKADTASGQVISSTNDDLAKLPYIFLYPIDFKRIENK